MGYAFTPVSGKLVGYGESGRRKEAVGTIAYSAQAYSNGVPAPAGLCGFSTVVESLMIVDEVPPTPADSFIWDTTNQTIRRYTLTTGAYVEASGSQTFNVLVRVIGW